jgi:tyrosinase
MILSLDVELNRSFADLLQSASPRIEGTNDINPMSWFGLASIHGLPHESWDNAQIVRNARGDVANYCTHASVLFPTWHRAYLAVFEVCHTISPSKLRLISYA